MGLARPAGNDVGVARGRIEIDTSGVSSIPGIVQAAAQAAAKSMSAVDVAATKNQASFAASTTAAQNYGTAMAGSLAAARQAVQQFAATASGSLAQARAAMQATTTSSQSLTAAIQASIKASNTKYLINNAPAPVFQQQGGGGLLSSLGGVGGIVRGIAGGLGVGLGVAGIVAQTKALAEGAVAATELATAYNRQSVAAVNLAGSQSRLNTLLETYSAATGGAVNDATSLANVTQLMAVGFADSSTELDKFATAIRGISVAMGQSQDMVTQNLILELFTQRGARLDQLGLQYDKVKQRAKELADADSSLTAKQAYQNAVLEQATERYGKLAKSAAGSVTGIENAGKAADNARLAIGRFIAPPINLAADIVAGRIQHQTDLLRGEIQAANDLWRALQRAFGVEVTTGFQKRFIASSVSRDVGRHSSTSNYVNPNAEEIQQVHLDWAKGVQAVNEQMHADIIDEETSFGQQRAKTVADYNKSVSRDEQAYALTRLRENMDFLDALTGVAKDATRREQGAADDLARSMTQAQADSADKVANARDDANKRLVELDENYEKARVKRAKDLSDKLLDAAGNLDAKQVYQLQRDAAKQEEEAKSAHDDQRGKIGEQLQERLDDEAKSLAKSLKQQQDNYDRQIEQGRENDRLKLEDMRTAFVKQQAREAEDHQTQVDQRAVDQAAELTAIDTQHNLKLEQIANHAAADRAALDEQAKTDLLALGVRNAAWKKVQDDKITALEKLWDDFMRHVNGTLLEGRPNTPAIIPAAASGGFVARGGLALIHQGEYIMPARNVSAGMMGSSSKRISIGDIHINVGSTNASAGDIGRAVRQEILSIFEETA